MHRHSKSFLITSLGPWGTLCSAHSGRRQVFGILEWSSLQIWRELRCEVLQGKCTRIKDESKRVSISSTMDNIVKGKAVLKIHRFLDLGSRLACLRSSNLQGDTMCVPCISPSQAFEECFWCCLSWCGSWYYDQGLQGLEASKDQAIKVFEDAIRLVNNPNLEAKIRR